MDKSSDVRRIVIMAIVGALIVILGGVVLRNSAFDFPITESFNSLHHGVIGSITNAIYTLFKPLYSVIWTIVISLIIMVARKNWRLGFVFGLTVLFTWLPITIMKAIVQRTRPDSELLPYPLLPTPADFSYPSGHTVIITIIMVCLVIVTTGTKLQMATRIIAPIAITIMVLTVLTVGVHFFTDAVASVIWGLTVAPLVWLALTMLFRTENPWTNSDSVEANYTDRESLTSEADPNPDSPPVTRT